MLSPKSSLWSSGLELTLHAERALADVKHHHLYLRAQLAIEPEMILRYARRFCTLGSSTFTPFGNRTGNTVRATTSWEWWSNTLRET
jgi:hypothetical protein